MHSSRQMGVCSCACSVGVVDDVVVAERLLDHHQVELVEPAQVVGIGQRVGGVGVGHQLDGGEALAHLPDDVHVPARLDLHLDALVAGGQFALDLFEQLLDTYPGCRWRRRRGSRAARRRRFSATAARPRRRASRSQTASSRPPRAIWWPRIWAVSGYDFGGAQQLAAEHARDGVIAQDQPGRIGPLLVVERVLAGGHFAPAGDAVAVHFHQDDVALGGAAEAGLEKVHQRHADLPQRDAFDFHGHGSSR